MVFCRHVTLMYVVGDRFFFCVFVILALAGVGSGLSSLVFWCAGWQLSLSEGRLFGDSSELGGRTYVYFLATAWVSSGGVECRCVYGLRWKVSDDVDWKVCVVL